MTEKLKAGGADDATLSRDKIAYATVHVATAANRVTSVASVKVKVKEAHFLQLRGIIAIVV